MENKIVSSFKYLLDVRNVERKEREILQLKNLLQTYSKKLVR